MKMFFGARQGPPTGPLRTAIRTGDARSAPAFSITTLALQDTMTFDEISGVTTGTLGKNAANGNMGLTVN